MLQNPIVRLFLGAALISLSPVWVKLVSVSPTTSGFYRVAFGATALVLYLLLRRRSLKFPPVMWGMLAIASVFFALDLWFWHRSINYIGPGLSTLLANFQVFFMTIAGFVLYRQRPNSSQLFAIPLALAGLALIVGLDWADLPADYRLGVVFGLLTAVAYAGYLLMIRAARAHADHSLPVREIAVVSIFVSLLLAISAGIEGESLAIRSWEDAGWLLAYGLLSHSLGMIFIASSLPHVTTAQAGLALLLQPTLSFVWDVLFFHRPMTAAEMLGAAMALCAIYLGARQRSDKPENIR